MAEPDEGPGVDDAEVVDLPVEDAAEVLYYLLDSSVENLALGQGVLFEPPMMGSGALQKVIPYAAVICDLTGEIWVYTSPGPLTFIKADTAVLVDGPDADTLVATVGVAELYGIDTKVGK